MANPAPEEPEAPLSFEDEMFVDLLFRLRGNQTKAWIASGRKDSPSAANNASRKMKDPKIRRAVERRRADLIAGTKLTTVRAVAILSDIANDPFVTANDRIRAILANFMILGGEKGPGFTPLNTMDIMRMGDKQLAEAASGMVIANALPDPGPVEVPFVETAVEIEGQEAATSEGNGAKDNEGPRENF